MKGRDLIIMGLIDIGKSICAKNHCNIVSMRLRL